MRTISLAIFMFLGALISYGQNETERYKTIVDTFETNYNEGKYDAIFDSFSPEMQKALPKKDSNNFFAGLKAQVGNIKSREFIQYANTAAIYKATFERMTFQLSISIDEKSKINWLLIKPFTEVPTPERTVTKLQLPFKGEWTVFWGGDTKEQNYHIEHRAQKNAFDFVITDESGKSYKTDGKTNDDYYAFGKELFAPCDGEVVLVVDGIKDNEPGKMNPVYVPGNTVIIETKNNEYLFFAHFKQHSIKVKEGQTIKQGKLLGLCGNSGNSSEPHLHFHVQNVEDMIDATGIKCFFETLIVNGEEKNDYSPVRGDKIKSE